MLSKNGVRRGYAIGAVVGLCAAASVAAGQTSVVVEGPTGWFGVTLADEGMIDERGTTFFLSYPVVSEVEPNSPAEKAGVRPGDVLMSFNSHDMRGTVFQLRNWLKPGAPFVLQLRRNDAVRVVRGTLGRAPKGWEKRIVLDVRPTEAFEVRTGTAPRPPRPSTQNIVVGTSPSSKVPPALIPSFPFGTGVFPFAGMEFIALNQDIRELLGVKPEGVFVTNVVEGSPARMAGLRGGDVLLLANGAKLTTPIDLVQAISEAQEAQNRTLNLRIIRNRKPRSLTLSW